MIASRWRSGVEWEGGGGGVGGWRLRWDPSAEMGNQTELIVRIVESGIPWTLHLIAVETVSFPLYIHLFCNVYIYLYK